MTESLLAREIESDLRQMILEAAGRRTIPHIRDRAERAAASIVVVSDQESLLRAMDEVLSTLLIATETGSVPRLIILSLNVLQKLVGYKGISSETFLHMVTVLCKAASSLTTVLSVSQGTALASEIETAQVRCLQTIHLLEVNELGDFFLDEICLSQMLSMCVNLANHGTSTPIVSQSAQASIPQLQLFVMDVSKQFNSASLDGSGVCQGDDQSLAVLNSLGELQGVSRLGDGLDDATRCLFFFFHDLITMAYPDLTHQVGCKLFGSGRIRPQLAIEMLGSFFSDPFWIKHKAFRCAIDLYLLPLFSKLMGTTLSENVQIDKLNHFRQLMRLFVKISRCDVDLGKIYVQIHNCVIEENSESTVQTGLRIMLTEIAVLCIASNKRVIAQSEPVSVGTVDVMAPMGGDSPIRHRSSTNIAESMVESVCMRVHHLASTGSSSGLFNNIDQVGIRSINQGSVANAFSVLYGVPSSNFNEEVSKTHEMAVYLDFVISYIDTVFKIVLSNAETGTINLPDSLAHSWASVLSCLVLVASHMEASGASPGVLGGIEKLLNILALADHKEGMSACIGSVLKLKCPGVNRFTITAFHRLASDSTIIENISIESWRQIMRRLEIISTGTGISEDSPVQELAMDTFFRSPGDARAVEVLTTALAGQLDSSWALHRLSQLLTSDQATPLVVRLWRELIAPGLTLLQADGPEKVRPTLVTAFLSLIEKVVTKYPDLECIEEVIECGKIFPNHQCVKTMVDTVEIVGHLLTRTGWSAVIDVAIRCLDEEKSSHCTSLCLRLAEIAIEDFIEKVEINFNKLLYILEKGAIQYEVLPATAGFKAVALAMLVGEYLMRTTAGPDDSRWTDLVQFFNSACTYKRAQVRNCALKTLGSILFPSHDTVAVQIAKTVIGLGRVASPVVTSNELDGLIVHHSRDSEEKRWSESIGLSLVAIGQVCGKVKKISNIDSLETIFVYTFSASEEVSTAGCKLFVDLWKLSGFIHHPVFESILDGEIEKILSCTEVLPKTTYTLLPILLGGTKNFACNIPSEVKKALFAFVSAAFTCPCMYLESAVPYPSKGNDNHWSSSLYKKEVEAFRPLVTECIDGLLYSLVPSATDLNPFLSSIIPHMILFEETDIAKLFLSPDLVFRNSYTLALAIRAVLIVTQNESKQLSSEVYDVLEGLVQTRNMSIGVASTGLWKWVLQILVFREVQSTAIKLLSSIGTNNTDPIDYSHVCFIVYKATAEQRDDLIAFFEHQLSQREMDPFKAFLIALVMLWGGLIERNHENKIMTSFEAGRVLYNRLNDDRLHHTVSSFIASEVQLTDGLQSGLIKTLRQILEKNTVHESIICCLIEILQGQIRKESELRKRIIRELWPLLAGTLVTKGSPAVRTSVSQLLVALGPSI